MSNKTERDDIIIEVPAGATIPMYLLLRAKELKQPVSYTLRNNTFDGAGSREITEKLTISPQMTEHDAGELFSKKHEELRSAVWYETRQDIPDMISTIGALVNDGQLTLAADKMIELTNASHMHDFPKLVAPLTQRLQKLGYTANTDETDVALRKVGKLFDEKRFDDAAKLVIGAFLKDYGDRKTAKTGEHSNAEDYIWAKGIHEYAGMAAEGKER